MIGTKIRFEFDEFFKIMVENTEYNKELMQFFMKLNKNM